MKGAAGSDTLAPSVAAFLRRRFFENLGKDFPPGVKAVPYAGLPPLKEESKM
jgi:hypothetical protein